MYEKEFQELLKQYSLRDILEEMQNQSSIIKAEYREAGKARKASYAAEDERILKELIDFMVRKTARACPATKR